MLIRGGCYLSCGFAKEAGAICDERAEGLSLVLAKYGIRAFASFPHEPMRSLQVRFQIFFARSSDSTPKAQQSQGSNSVFHSLDRESASERNYANCRHDEMIRLDSAESQAFPNPPWDIRALNIPNNVSQEPSDLYQFFDTFPTNRLVLRGERVQGKKWCREGPSIRPVSERPPRLPPATRAA